ncbi:preprotein translocase subunit SecY [Patescibacteria group bacterium]|nr:preprotein translocase subunit SecY [Patescibacteria group bacterium]MBP9710175.1 preprotein translocase subunit SecY [Patescibacteria group bacterium]
MWDKLFQALRVKEVRNGLLFVLAMMIVFRVAANIPLPGIDLIALQSFFEANQLLGVLNLFSGGTIRNFSIVALGVAPYITASIVFQLLGMLVPRIEEIQKDGEAGQRKINQWTRLLTVPLAIIQSISLIGLMKQSQFNIIQSSSPVYLVAIVCTVTAGTLILMWIGELISEKKVGNGMSLLIAAGILADLPSAVSQFLATFDQAQWVTVALYAAVAILTVLGVVFVTEGQRNIPVQYARQVRGQGVALGGVASSLPLRVNMVGVIPIIFAVSMLLFPNLIAQFLARARSEWLASIGRWVNLTLQNQTVYGVLYFLLVVGFTYFYTSVVFHPDRIAENLQKQGGFVPGIRPGRPTAEYVEYIINRITLGGAAFLGIIAIMPLAVQGLTGATQLALGGTSMLIVVSVVIESVKQVEAQATMREYDAY